MMLFCFCSTEKEWFKQLTIVASNDLNEETLYSLAQQVGFWKVVFVIFGQRN